MNKYMIISILTLILIFSGCVQNEGKTVYFSEKNNETITLYDDFTATVITSKEGISGTYRIDGDHVILVLAPFGTVIDFKKEGNKLVSAQNGEYWRKHDG